MVSTTTPYRAALLRAARDRLGWKKPRLVYALRQAAAQEGRSLPTDTSLLRSIARWENGQTHPTDYVELLVKVYGEPAHRLGLADVPATQETPGTAYPTTPTDGIESLAALWRADLAPGSDVQALSPDPAAWNAAPLVWLVSGGQEQLPNSRTRTQVGACDVETVRATVDVYADLDNRFGGGHGRRALIQYLDGDVAELLTARSTEPVGRALFATVAEATLLAAWMSYDSGHHGLAQRYFIQALRLAQTAEDRRLAGSILSAMSHQATYLGRFIEAANLARAAQLGTTGHATPTLTAQFLAMEARALSRLGDHAACNAALTRATTIFERNNPGEDPEWIGYFDQAELSVELGHCFRDMRQARQATTYAEQCLGGTDGHYIRSDFFATMVLAEAHLAAGELERACRTALDALTIGRQLKSARCVSYLAAFRKKVDSRSDSTAVAEFLEEAAGYRMWQQAAG
ncbi:hypothetical protein [Embleya sp. NBC_00896]|uniref:hypothetical protein n=1 Tax=Embleya sp. NBC_00896 TaxID=2975961 RepID=UPI003869C691|nr:hypothetical protein OG928_16250 [Embleya sp. NBC_00896]WSY13180.1 hypothetical protein OG928_16295 [Embleya sp. NBC_00896]WSY13189.1 hypothetical protein OG928_16340 [Embleya sp. NBC_00896]